MGPHTAVVQEEEAVELELELAFVMRMRMTALVQTGGAPPVVLLQLLAGSWSWDLAKHQLCSSQMKSMMMRKNLLSLQFAREGCAGTHSLGKVELGHNPVQSIRHHTLQRRQGNIQCAQSGELKEHGIVSRSLLGV